MFLARSLRMWFAIGLVFFAIGCTLVSSMPETSTPLPVLPTPTTPPVQNTSTPASSATVKLILRQSPADNSGGVEGLAFSPDGKVLASLHKNGRILLWDAAAGQNIRSLAGGGETEELGVMPGFAFSPDGKSLVSKATGDTPMIWDVATGQSIEVESGLQRSNGMALSPDGRLLAYGKCAKVNSLSICDQYDIILWELATHQPVGQPFKFDVGAIAPLGLLFSPDGQVLAAMSSGTTGSGRIELFDVATRQPIASPLGGEVQFSGMAFSPGGHSLMLGSTGGVIYMWDMQSQKVVAELTGERGIVTGMTFSPDGRMLASRILIPSTEHIPREKIILWNMSSFQTLGQPLTGQAATGSDVGFSSIAFSPDGRTLASGTDDGVIILWDLTTDSPSP